MKCLCNPTYTHAQTEKLIDAGTLIYVNMIIVHRLISILYFFGHSHSSIDNSYELFICCTCNDNLSNKNRTALQFYSITIAFGIGANGLSLLK